MTTPGVGLCASEGAMVSNYLLTANSLSGYGGRLIPIAADRRRGLPLRHSDFKRPEDVDAVDYAHEHELHYGDRVPPNNGGTVGTEYFRNWVSGWLTLDGGDNLGFPGRNNPDNTNVVYLRNSLLWPNGANSLGLWRCPADRALSTIGGNRYP